MKIIAAVALAVLGFSLTAAQECTEITESQVELVFLNAVIETLSEGTLEPAGLDRLHEYNLNCLAPGCMRDTYRSLTITADFSYTTTSTMREVRQLDLRCIFGMNDEPVWQSQSATGSSIIQGPELVDFLLTGETLESCASCNVFRAPQNISHCEACHPDCLTEPGLMRCTGSSPNDCYRYFDRQGMCVQNCSMNQAPDEDFRECVCINFYSGPNCEDCILEDLCRNDGDPDDECLTCNCTECYSGLLCEEHPCEPNPCQNGGTCSCTDVETRQASCMCPPRFTGEFCEIELGSCVPNPCLNGGTCEVIMGEAVCTCPKGYTGEFCETIDNCYPNPCRNNGTCLNTNDGFICICVEVGTGALCDEIPVGPNACCPSPCYNKQLCILTDDEAGFRCDCQDGFVGELCEQSQCGMSSCQNGGTCVEPVLTGHPYCQCPSTRKGDQCQKCASTHVKLVTSDCILDCDESCEEYEDDAFEYDLCRYYCHAESWIAKLTKCGYTPPTISEESPSSDRKMVWEKVKSERQRALDWWSELDPTCYPLPEPPYTPPPPTVSSGPPRSGTGSSRPDTGTTKSGSGTSTLEPNTGTQNSGSDTSRSSRSSRSSKASRRSSRSTSRSDSGPIPHPGFFSTMAPPTQEPAMNNCVDEYLIYLRGVIEQNPSWFEYTMKSDAILSEEDATAMFNDLNSDSYQEDISEVYRPLLQYWAAQFSTYCEQHEGQCSL